MAELNLNKLRKVRLEEVARYLECKPEKLRIALKHLAAVPSAIQYSKDAAVSINPAVRHVALTPEEEAKAASLAALRVIEQREWNKILSKAFDRLDRAGGTGNYTLEEVVALLEAEKAASMEALYQAAKPAMTRYCKMKPADEKWRN
jgi:hypothetical protein